MPRWSQRLWFQHLPTLSEAGHRERDPTGDVENLKVCKYQSSLRDCGVGHPINYFSVVKEPEVGESQVVSFPNRPESTTHSPHWLLRVEQDVTSPPSQAMREPRAHPEF